MQFDVVIVGGGAHGCALAYELAKNNRSVAVVEARSLAAEASGGFGKRGVRANFRDIREMRLMAEAHEHWPRLADELEGETGYVRTGGLFLVEKEAVGTTGGVVASKVRASTQTRLGIPTEVWDQKQVFDALPTVSNAIRCGIYTPQDGIASHEATTLSYANAAQRNGAVFIENTTVAGINTQEGGHATGVTTATGEAIVARQSVVVTANVASAGLIGNVYGGSLPTWPVYPQALLLKSQHKPEIPFLTGHDSRSLSIKILENDLVMLSGGWRGQYDPETGRGTTIQANLDGNIAELRTVFPGLGELELIRAEASRSESSCIDQIPIIDVVPGSTNVVVAAGWSGHGWALVPSVARNLAAWIHTGHKPSALKPFTFSRLSLEAGQC
ncbi:FAD-binding oxidoreductase [Brevibacterium aurantiacum]|nr:FAD-binding oxidoreductase [Brevibacterium aurantiacum]